MVPSETCGVAPENTAGTQENLLQNCEKLEEHHDLKGLNHTHGMHLLSVPSTRVK